MVGTATISIEIELGWGLVRFGKLDKLSENREAETRYLSRLLDQCDEYDVPITFNIVGHLLHESCDGTHDSPHDESWWDVDPGTSVDEDPEFYAPDLIEDIRSRSTDHEICTHTYSHIECDEVDPEIVRWELEQAQRIHDEYGLPKNNSIVPPRHSTPPSDVLTDTGIRVKRTPHYEAEGVDRPSTRIEKLLEILFGTHPAIEPAVEQGLLETYSPEYMTFAAPFLQAGRYRSPYIYRSIPLFVRQRLHERNLTRGLDAAATADSFVHYWSHLYDFSNNQQWPQVESFVRRLSERREAGEIRVRTMQELQSDYGPQLSQDDYVTRNQQDVSHSKRQNDQPKPLEVNLNNLSNHSR